MESPINLCLMKIFTEIPEEIIELAFKKRKTFERDYTLDQMVTTYIIHNRVLKMLNLFGGKIKQIFLLPQYMEKLHRELLDNAAATSPFAIYRIPPEVREDLDIIDVIDVQFISQVNLNLQASPFINHSNSMGSFGHAILDSHTSEYMYSVPHTEALNGNLIKLPIVFFRSQLHILVFCQIDVMHPFGKCRYLYVFQCIVNMFGRLILETVNDSDVK